MAHFFIDNRTGNGIFLEIITADKKQVELFEDLHLLNVQKLNKISLLQDIIPERLNRRAKRGNLPYTREFQQIVEHITAANDAVSYNAGLLKKLIIDGEEIPDLHELNYFGAFLDAKLEEWHTKHMGDFYYLHALMEVSMVIYELRWIYREQQRLVSKAGRIPITPE